MKSVIAGGSHSAAVTVDNKVSLVVILLVTVDNKVFMWGLNKGGQCGSGNNKVESIMEPRPIDSKSIDLAEGDGGVHGKSSDWEVQQMCCGRSHSALLTASGRLFVWGEASFGRLGQPDSSSFSVHNNKRYSSFPVEVPFFKNNSIRIQNIACGDFHMLALTDGGDLYSWVILILILILLLYYYYYCYFYHCYYY